VITQLISPQKVKVETKISFAAPVGLAVLESESSERRLMSAILERERELMRKHRLEYY
jgi:hypothetical protein